MDAGGRATQEAKAEGWGEGEKTVIYPLLQTLTPVGWGFCDSLSKAGESGRYRRAQQGRWREGVEIGGMSRNRNELVEMQPRRDAGTEAQQMDDAVTAVVGVAGMALVAGKVVDAGGGMDRIGRLRAMHVERQRAAVSEDGKCKQDDQQATQHGVRWLVQSQSNLCRGVADVKQTRGRPCAASGYDSSM